MKHTQGEWKIKPYTKDQKIHSSIGGFNVVMNGQHIAALSQNLTMPLPEVEANAKLIVVAPEMLEVLKQFIHSVEHEGAVNGRIVDAVRNAKAIIQKATN